MQGNAEPSVQGIDVERVSRWLELHVAGAVAPFAFDVIAGGRSNLTYRVTGADGTRFVLRRPPLGHVLATAHDMAREHRIISAVGSTGVPVPAALGLCTDDEVNGVPFYVMAFVDGVVLDSPVRGEALPAHLRCPAAEHLVDVLADLHAVDVDAVGLGTLAKREGYVERQVKRWSAQWDNSKTRELTAVEEVARLLRNQLPDQQGVSIAHGDYRFGNVLTDVQHGRVAAVLDWELCTLGDPLADLGYFCMALRLPRNPALPGLAGLDRVALGIPDEAGLIERYQHQGHRSSIGDWPFVLAFKLSPILISAWKLARTA